MPCYDGRANGQGNWESRIIYKDNPNDKIEINKLVQQNRGLEAGLCAIITELEKRGLANEILPEACKNGMINLMDFWSHHSKEDETRLVIELNKFSEHEQSILKKLLNK